MKLLFIIVIFILLKCIYCAKNKGTWLTGEYLELDHIFNTVYMFTNDKCTLTYLCKTRKDGNI